MRNTDSPTKSPRRLAGGETKDALYAAARDFSARNRVPVLVGPAPEGGITKEDAAARLAVCEKCPHHAVGIDGHTCDRCTTCETKCIRFTLARWQCPAGKWGDILWLINGGIGDAMLHAPVLRAMLNAGHLIDVRLTGRGAPLTASLLARMGVRIVDEELTTRTPYRAVLCDCRLGKLQERAAGIATGAVIAPRQWEGHIVEWTMDCAEQIGVTAEAPHGALAGLLPQGHRHKVIVGPGAGPSAGNNRKCWDGWPAFAEEARRIGLDIVVVGASDARADWQDAEGIDNRVGTTPTLDDLLPIFADADLYVGIDNGLGHFAAACGIPTLTVFTVTDPRRYRPWHPEAQAVHGRAIDGAGLALRAARIVRRTPSVHMRRPLLSVIIGTHNEGDEVRLTCESVHDHAGCETEIVIVDDHSTDGSCDDLPDYVRVVKAPGKVRLGVAPSRNIGAGYATGAGITFLDAHMRTEPGALGRMLETALDRRACVAACLSNLYGSDRVWYGSYAEIREDKARLSSRFYKRPHPNPLWETNCFVAPGYVLPRAVFERIGGWPSLLRGWGQTEITLAVKLWLAGVPILVDQGARLQHKFRSSFPYRVRNTEVLRNNRIMCGVAFDKSTVERFWLPLMRRHRYWRDEIDEDIDERTFGAEAEQFHKIKVRSDEDWFRAVLGLSIDEAIATWVSRPRGGTDAHIARARRRYQLSQDPAELEALLALVRTVHPTRILEIGTQGGGWDYAVASVAGRGAAFLAVDIAKHRNPQRRALADELKARGMSYEWMIGDSTDPAIVGQVKDRMPEVDVLHIDGDHTYEGCKADFQNYAPLVRKGGLIVFHDAVSVVDSQVGVKRFWDELRRWHKRRHKKQYTFFSEFASAQRAGMGIAVIRV